MQQPDTKQDTACRYWSMAGRLSRLVIVTIGTSPDDARTVRAIVAEAARIGVPTEQQNWGTQTSLLDGLDIIHALNSTKTVFAVLVMPDVPEHFDSIRLERAISPSKAILESSEGLHTSCLSKDGLDALMERLIDVHRRHVLAQSQNVVQSAR